MAFDRRKRVAELLHDLCDLCKKREFFDDQIIQVNLALSSLARGIEDEKERQAVLDKVAAARRKPGLTERVARTLRGMPHSYMSAREIREWVEREGTDLSGYSQPLATISITLRRMAEVGRLKVAREGRNVTYRWNGD